MLGDHLWDVVQTELSEEVYNYLNYTNIYVHVEFDVDYRTERNFEFLVCSGFSCHDLIEYQALVITCLIVGDCNKLGTYILS